MTLFEGYEKDSSAPTFELVTNTIVLGVSSTMTYLSANESEGKELPLVFFLLSVYSLCRLGSKVYTSNKPEQVQDFFLDSLVKLENMNFPVKELIGKQLAPENYKISFENTSDLPSDARINFEEYFTRLNKEIDLRRVQSRSKLETFFSPNLTKSEYRLCHQCVINQIQDEQNLNTKTSL